MRQIGEQWVEVIDGKHHLLMIVENTSKLVCNGCSFGYYQAGDHHCKFGLDCPASDGIIKDLGVLNEDGCLPNGWGEYPRIEAVKDVVTYKISYRCVTRNGIYCVTELYSTEQEAIEAWNRRV